MTVVGTRRRLAPTVDFRSPAFAQDKSRGNDVTFDGVEMCLSVHPNQRELSSLPRRRGSTSGRFALARERRDLRRSGDEPVGPAKPRKVVVTPARAGVHLRWIPACAGMTVVGARRRLALTVDSPSRAFAEDKFRGNDVAFDGAKNTGSSWGAAAKLPPWNPNEKAVADATALHQGAFGTSILKPNMMGPVPTAYEPV